MIFTAPDDLSIELQAIGVIDDLRQQLRWRVAESRSWFGGIRRLIFARAVQGSNSIEGYNASVDDVLAVVEGEETMDATLETRLALEGYRDAMTYVLQLTADEGVDVDESLLKALHFMMLKHDLTKRPGRWRAGDVFVRKEPIGEIVYEAPDVALVPHLIHELIDCFGQSQGPVLVRAAMAHLNLVMIHPFKDGNGRMGRCLQTLVLARERIVSPVFSSIEEQLGRDTEAYYEILGRVGQGSWHPENDTRPWIRFCLNAHYQQAQRVLWLVSETEHLWGRCEELAAERSLPARAVGPLCDAARGLRVHNWTYRTAVQESEGEELDAATASRDLRALVKSGLLEARGETRGRFYVGTDALREAFRSVRALRPNQDRLDMFEDKGEQLRFGLGG
jgi:Fic family protein